MSPKRSPEQHDDERTSSLAERLVEVAEPLLRSDGQSVEREHVVGLRQLARIAWNLAATLPKRGRRAEDRQLERVLSSSPVVDRAELYLLLVTLMSCKRIRFESDKRLIADVKLLEHQPGARPRIEVNELGIEALAAQRAASVKRYENGVGVMSRATTNSRATGKEPSAPRPPRQFVIDLRHYRTASGLWRDVSPQARKFALYMGEIAAGAIRELANKSGPRELDVVCHKRTGANRCKGRIAVRAVRAGEPIEWMCVGCGESGSVDGWRGSVWDCAQRERELAELPEKERVTLRLNKTDLRALAELQCSTIALSGAVFRALPDTDELLQLVLSRRELEELAMALTAECIEYGHRGQARRIVELERRCFEGLGYGPETSALARTSGVLGFRAHAERRFQRSVPRVPGAGVHRLSVALERVEPAVTRQLAVRSDTTLEELHAILQVAFGWSELHLHMFVVGGKSYMHEQQMEEMDALPSKSATLLEILPEPGARMLYEYDFGDDWRHIVRVRSIEPSQPGEMLPRCEGGQNSAPPEDVGGASGYQDFLAAVDDPEHEQHEDFRDWLGRPFDPHAFDLELTNRLLAMLGRCQEAGG